MIKFIVADKNQGSCRSETQGTNPLVSGSTESTIMKLDPAVQDSRETPLAKDRKDLDELFAPARRGARKAAGTNPCRQAISKRTFPRHSRERTSAKLQTFKRDSSEHNLPRESTDNRKHGEHLQKRRVATRARSQRPSTEEGYRVYSLEELVTDQPLGMELSGPCPFDCNCCFY
jgi:hypothetical protein